MFDPINALVVLANFVIVPGIAYGSQLALGALGLTLVFGILRFANVYHGDLAAFGTAITILLTWWLQSAGVSLGPMPTALLALPFGMLAATALALAFDRMVFRHFRRIKAPGIVFVMASLGVMFIVNALVNVIIGPGDQRFADGMRFVLSAADFREATGLAEGLAIRLPVVLTVVMTIVAVASLFWFLQRTRTGKAMRAYSDNDDLALLSGINPERIVMVTWVIAACLATLAGVLYGLDKSFKPFTYFQLLLPFFAAAILGGIGHPIGAITGGFVVAFSEIGVTYAFKRVAEYFGFEPTGMLQLVSTDYKVAVSFLILVLVLIFRPTGIQGGRQL